jgi:hypothetical protein
MWATLKQISFVFLLPHILLGRFVIRVALCGGRNTLFFRHLWVSALAPGSLKGVEEAAAGCPDRRPLRR